MKAGRIDFPHNCKTKPQQHPISQVTAGAGTLPMKFPACLENASVPMISQYDLHFGESSSFFSRKLRGAVQFKSSTHRSLKNDRSALNRLRGDAMSVRIVQTLLTATLDLQKDHYYIHWEWIWQKCWFVRTTRAFMLVQSRDDALEFAEDEILKKSKVFLTLRRLIFSVILK